MPDYLQDLLDRVGDYMNPQATAAAYDPTATDEENKKKKKPPGPGDIATPLPWGQQAGMLPPQAAQPDTSTPVISQLLANPANPAYGVSPMSSPLSQAMAAKAALANQPPPPPPSMPVQSPAPFAAPGPFPAPLPEPEPNPSQVAAGTTPLPRARPAGAPPREQREANGDQVPAQPDSRATVPRSAVMQAGDEPSVIQQTGQQAGMLPSIGDIGSKIMSGLNQHSNLLLAMGAGLMGAPNLAQGLSRGFSYAGPAAQQDIRTQLLQGTQQNAFNALVSMGVPQNLARAGATDPEIRKSLIDAYMAPKMELKEIKTKNSWGQETTQLFAINPRNTREGYNVLTGQPLPGGVDVAGGRTVGTLPAGTSYPGGVRPAAAGGSGVAGGPGAPAAAVPGQPPSAFYAPGVTDENFDHTAVGPDYIKQFSPEVQQTIIDRIHGLAPSGGGRGGAQIQAQINMAAEKYGRDIGMPMDPAQVNQRRTYETNLATPDRGVGKQKSGAQQGLGHFGDLSDNLVAQHLTNAGNLPIVGEPLAGMINAGRAKKPEQAGLVNEAQGLAQYLSREMGKMSGGTSAKEAQEAAERLGDPFKSGMAAAGALRAMRQIYKSNLETMTNTRDELFPDPSFRPPGANFIGPREQAILDKIDRNIAILEGKTPRPQAQQAAGVTPKPKGTYDYDQATGGFIQR